MPLTSLHLHSPHTKMVAKSTHNNYNNKNAHFTPTLLLYFLFLTPLVSSLNITDILSHYPDLSDFTSILTSTGISNDLNRRTSLTILAVPNNYLRHLTPPTNLADVIRCHVIIQYLTWPDLRRSPPSGTLLTTLFQTTGRAANNLGFLNVTFNPSNGVVSLHPSDNSTQSTNVISLVKTVPYDLSIFTVDSLLSSYGFDLMASETQPPGSPAAVNITQALMNGHNFNVAAAMLAASGVVEEFEADEGGAGITIFVPTDAAFANLPPTVQLQALSADRKALVLKFHVLHSYYPLGSLDSIVNPVQPTLATEDNGAGSYTLNISRVNGSVEISTGLVQAVVTQTVLDQNPVAIFGVSRVLLPREIFGSETGKGMDVGVGNGSGPFVAAPSPEYGPAPEGALPPVGYSGPTSHWGEISGGCLKVGRNWGLVVLFCIGMSIV